VRDAHATDEYQRFGRDWARAPEDKPEESVFVFSLAQRQIPLPLGWMLSGRAAGEMVDEMPKAGAASSGFTGAVRLNQVHLGEVLKFLRRMHAKEPASAPSAR
jgi:hypothetical protein